MKIQIKKKQTKYGFITKISEHDIKLSYGLYFLGRAQEARDETLNQLLLSIAKNPTSTTVDLMWLSIKIEAELDEIELPISKRDFIDFLEESDDYDNKDGLIVKWSKGLDEVVRGHFLPKKDANEIEVSPEEEEEALKKK